MNKTIRFLSIILSFLLIFTLFPTTAFAADVYTVSFDANGGTGTIASETVNAGTEITLNNGSTLTAPEGKTFGGWALSSTALEAAFEGGVAYTPTSDVTFYAVWVNE